MPDSSGAVKNDFKMLDIKFIRVNPEKARAAIQDRSGRYLAAFEDLVNLDKEWRTNLTELESLRARQNQIAGLIGRLRKGDSKTVTGDLDALMSDGETLKASLKNTESKTAELEKTINELLLSLPNIPHESVPKGKTPEDNKVVRECGAKPKFDFTPRDHQGIGEKLGILDFAVASKLSGSRFVLLRGDGARLERTLINFMLDLHTKEHGYLEIFPPFMVTGETMTGTGQLPKFAEELYKCKDDDLYLIPTAEVPLTNIHRGEIIDEAKLPMTYCAYTACFRREAGSYGKDARGLIRNHQFNKIELVRFVKPEDSLAELETLTKHAEEVLKRLKIPYRVVELCTGDLGFGSAKTYDLEVWMPGEQKWREISSCSAFTDFQARRIGIKLKRTDGKREFLHTLNGSGLAVGRTFAAILENYQTVDGFVKIPDVLQPYFGKDKIS